VGAGAGMDRRLRRFVCANAVYSSMSLSHINTNRHQTLSMFHKKSTANDN
jgi:hypothetical protein